MMTTQSLHVQSPLGFDINSPFNFSSDSLNANERCQGGNLGPKESLELYRPYATFNKDRTSPVGELVQRRTLNRFKNVLKFSTDSDESVKSKQ
jgi:hypothetical protein